MEEGYEDDILLGTNWSCSRCGIEFDERDRGVVVIDEDCVKCPQCGKTLVR